MFFDKKHSKSLDFCFLKPGLYPSITDIVEAMNTLIQERHNYSANSKTVSHLKRLEARKKLRFTLHIKDLVLHSFVRI